MELFSSLLHCGRRNLNQTSTQTGRPQLIRIVSPKAILASNFTVHELNCKHYDPLVMALTYMSSFYIFFFAFGQEEYSSWFLCCLVFPHFRHSYYFMKSDSYNSATFQFPFQTKPKYTLLLCQPLHRAGQRTKDNVPRISLYQGTILILHLI